MLKPIEFACFPIAVTCSCKLVRTAAQNKLNVGILVIFLCILDQPNGLAMVPYVSIHCQPRMTKTCTVKGIAEDTDA